MWWSSENRGNYSGDWASVGAMWKEVGGRQEPGREGSVVRKVGGLGNGSGTLQSQEGGTGPVRGGGWRAVRAVEGGGRW